MENTNEEFIEVEVTEEDGAKLQKKKIKKIAIWTAVGVGAAAALIYTGKVLKDNEVIEVIDVIEEITD